MKKGFALFTLIAFLSVGTLSVFAQDTTTTEEVTTETLSNEETTTEESSEEVVSEEEKKDLLFSNNETKTSVIIEDEDGVKQQGSFYIGTSSGLIFNNSKIEGVDESTSSINLEAHVAYFVIDNLSILTGISSHEKDQDILFSLRYYMYNFFPEVGYKLYGNKQTSTIFGVGYNHMLNENISVDPTISFENTSKDGNKLSSDFSFKLNLGIYF